MEPSSNGPDGLEMVPYCCQWVAYKGSPRESVKRAQANTGEGGPGPTLEREKSWEERLK